CGKLAKGQAGLVNLLDDFVINVGDIHHVRDRVLFEFEIPPHQVAEQERAPVADMRVVVNGGSAAIDPNRFSGWVQRNELLQFTGQRIEQFKGHKKKNGRKLVRKTSNFNLQNSEKLQTPSFKRFQKIPAGFCLEAQGCESASYPGYRSGKV